MEKFKESLPLDQQENRSERTKNSSRSFSPHEGFGRSQENTQQDCSNTLQLEQISNKLSIKERKLQEIKEEKKSADQIFKDVSQLLENIDNIDVVSRNAYIRGQENDKMDKIFKNVKELQKIKQIISNISTKLELYSIKWEYQEEFLKMNEWMNCLNERGKILSGYQGSSDNNTIMLNGEVEFRENLEILKSIKKDLEDNRNKLEQLLEQTLKSKNGSHLINLIEKKYGLYVCNTMIVSIKEALSDTKFQEGSKTLLEKSKDELQKKLSNLGERVKNLTGLSFEQFKEFHEQSKSQPEEHFWVFIEKLYQNALLASSGGKNRARKKRSDLLAQHKEAEQRMSLYEISKQSEYKISINDKAENALKEKMKPDIEDAIKVYNKYINIKSNYINILETTHTSFENKERNILNELGDIRNNYQLRAEELNGQIGTLNKEIEATWRKMEKFENRVLIGREKQDLERHACQEEAQGTASPRPTTSDRESHTSAESLVNASEESGEPNPNRDGAKKREHLELLAQMRDNPRQKKPIDMLRRTSSENALAQRGQAEKIRLDFLSKTEKQRQSREDWWKFLEEEKASLESSEKSLRQQMSTSLEKYSKQQVFEAFKQEVKKLLQKSEKQLKQKSQEHTDSERLDQQAMQAAKRLLEVAKSNLERRHEELAETDPLMSAAVKQIANEVDNFLNQQGEDDQGSANQSEKQELKQVIESRLQQSLENLQRSLEIALPLLDYARLKNNSAQYSKELEEDFKSLHPQMEDIQKKLQKNKEQFEKMREEEKEIYGNFSLKELTPDGNVSYFEIIPAELFNALRAHDEYRTYDHTVVLKYAQIEMQEAFEDLVKAIKHKCGIEKITIFHLENVANHEKCISNTIGDLVRNNLKEDCKQAKDEANQAYKRANGAETERWKASACYEKAYEAYKGARTDDEIEMAFANLAKTFPICNDARNKQALADEELEAAERKLNGQYEPLLKALQDEQMQFQPIYEDLKEEQNNANKQREKLLSSRCVTCDDLARYSEAKKRLEDAKLYLGSLKEYSRVMTETQKKYNKYEEAIEKVKKAEVLSDKIKSVIDEYKHLYHAQKSIQEQKERLTEIKTYQNLKEELEQVQKHEKAISAAIDKTSQELGELKLEEEEAKKLNSLLKKPAKMGIELYQVLDRMDKRILEMEKELKMKGNEGSLMQSKLKSMDYEITQIENNLENKRVNLDEYEKPIENIIEQCKSLEGKRTAIREDNLSQLKETGNEKIDEILFLQESMMKIKSDMEHCTSTIIDALKQRNKIDEKINKNKGKVIQEYKDFKIQICQAYQKASKHSFINSIETIKNGYSQMKHEYKEKFEESIVALAKKKEISMSIYERLDHELTESQDKIDKLGDERHRLQLEDKQFVEAQNSSSSSKIKSENIKIILNAIKTRNDKVDQECDRYNEMYGLKLPEYHKVAGEIKKLVEQYDRAIPKGLIFRNAATLLYESEKQKYSEEKAGFLEEITRERKEQNNKKIGLQSKLNQINDEIASEKKKLSSKKEERKSLQEKLDTIRLETSQLAEKIDIQKKEKKKLGDEIKALKWSETKAMRSKEKVTDLAIERIVQLYGLVLRDPKVPSVSPTATGRGAQETVTPSSPRQIQETRVFPGQQAGPLAPREQEDDLTSESSSDDEWSILL